ncbi:MAG: SAM-dependent methyltransferase [Phycisphaerae bacterium]|nr:SAM-dependent methyltransferase [Phycisphaerae bacterium]|tara:strand:+ start:82 stop:906 length:825 start_codon:yes stop_codon:yes gene_type:complete
MEPEHLQANRAMWDERVPIHAESDLYDVPGFLAGSSRLCDFEVTELGPVEGRSLLHLQCHFGLDTLSWARAGADVTGVDFSEPAIRVARDLAGRTGLDACFEVCDVHEAGSRLGRRFDIVYTGRGALCWLPDLRTWAAEIADLLEPGGRFYMPEFHPFTDVFHDERLEVTESYFDGGRPYRDETPGTYTDPDAETRHNLNFTWTHPVSEVITTLVRAGLVLDSFHEHDFTVFPRFTALRKADDGDIHRFPDGHPRLPLMYSILMHKPPATDDSA